MIFLSWARPPRLREEGVSPPDRAPSSASGRVSAVCGRDSTGVVDDSAAGSGDSDAGRHGSAAKRATPPAESSRTPAEVALPVAERLVARADCCLAPAEFAPARAERAFLRAALPRTTAELAPGPAEPALRVPAGAVVQAPSQVVGAEAKVPGQWHSLDRRASLGLWRDYSNSCGAVLGAPSLAQRSSRTGFQPVLNTDGARTLQAGQVVCQHHRMVGRVGRVGTGWKPVLLWRQV